MDPISGALLGLGGSLLGGLFGMGAQGAANAQSNAQRQQALQQWMQVANPDPQTLQAVYQKLQDSDMMTPELEQTFTQGPSQVSEKLNEMDGTAKSAQLNALSQLQEMSRPGLTDADKAELTQAQSQEAMAERGQRGAIMQNQAARGLSGSGSELASQLVAQQGGANAMSSQGLGAVQMAQQRALSSLGQAGQLGGSIQNQQMQQALAAGQAQDAINRFNTQNSQGVAGSNIAALNNAQMANIANTNKTNAANTDIANQQAIQHAGAYQTAFNDAATKAKGEGDVLTGQATATQAQGQAAAAGYNSIGSGINSGFGSIAQYLNNKQKPGPIVGGTKFDNSSGDFGG